MAKSTPFPDLDPGHKRTFWETIVVTTPVVLTVIATVLAGLSSSEMSSSQYFRSLAAQMQAKVSDQWGYFQSKKLRAEQCENTITILAGVSPQLPGSAAAFRDAVAKNPATQPAATHELEDFYKGAVPEVADKPIDDAAIKDAMNAVSSTPSESDLEHQAGKLNQKSLDDAITVANQNSMAFDAAAAAQSDSYAKIAAAIEPTAKDNPSLRSAIAAAQLRFSANRYQREARYNQALADLLELQVRRQGFTSDRYRVRSKEFFYGMLAAQAGVTVATFSLAVRRRNLLWGLAASAGLAAVTFAAYVYVFV